MTTVAFRPERILAVLAKHNLDFVLIGGLAAQLHGSPLTTRDVDLTPQKTLANFERLSAALTDLRAVIRTDDDAEVLPFAHNPESLMQVRVWNLRTRYGDLDISIEPSGTLGYDDLRRDARPVSAFGGVFVVASLGDIIRSKQAANRPKDQRALPVLREIWATRHERETD